MRTMRRPRVAIALTAMIGAVAVVAGFIPSGSTATGAISAQNYFGKTSQGLNVQLDVLGNVLHPDTIEAKDGYWNGLKIPFKGNGISYHRTSGHVEQWIEVRREQAGRVIAGWVRFVSTFPGYRRHDSGKVSFTVRLWASSEGVAWAGKTSDGKPLFASVGYVPERPHHNAVHPFTVTNLSRSLTCRGPDGASTFQVTIPDFAGVMHGGYFAGGFRAPGTTVGYTDAKPAHGSAMTAEGVSARATVNVSKLAPQGSGLVATGTLKLEGTATGDAGSYACQPVTTTFTLKPR